ncbi:MAG: Rieske (2Fe-2S) protein [Acidobacteriota bacterium]
MDRVFENPKRPTREGRLVSICAIEAVPDGRGAAVTLKEGGEIAVFNVGGQFFATENFCPHRGFPLADARLYGLEVECDLHGWRFDLRTGDCLVEGGCPVEIYQVVVEEGTVKAII